VSTGRQIETIPTLSRRERPMLAATMISSLVLRTQSDVRLAALAGEGSEAAFEAIVQRYRRDLLAYCSRLLLSDSRAEDAVQQTLLSAWTALRGGVEVEHLKPWLYRITHNSAISTLRRPGWDFDELSESLSGRDAPESDLERRMLMRETLAAVAALPGEQRQAILRTAVEGDSYAAVAASMGVSDHAVRGLVHRARVNLRATMAAIAPPPLVLWAAGLGRRHAGALAWLSDTLAGGGGAGASVGAGAVVIKSAAVLASSAALVGGTIAEHHAPTIRHAGNRTHSVAAASSRAASPAEAVGDSSRPAGHLALEGVAGARGSERASERMALTAGPARRLPSQAGAAAGRPASIDVGLPEGRRTGAARVTGSQAPTGSAQPPAEARRMAGPTARTPTGRGQTRTPAAAGQTQTPAAAGQTQTAAAAGPRQTGRATGQTTTGTGETTTTAGQTTSAAGQAQSSGGAGQTGLSPEMTTPRASATGQTTTPVAEAPSPDTATAAADGSAQADNGA